MFRTVSFHNFKENRVDIGKVNTWKKKKIATRPRIRMGDSNLVKRPQPLSLVSSAVGWDAVMDGWSVTPGDILFLDCPSPRWMCGRLPWLIKTLREMWARWMSHEPPISVKSHLENRTLSCLPFWAATAKAPGVSRGGFWGTVARSSRCLSQPIN